MMPAVEGNQDLKDEAFLSNEPPTNNFNKNENSDGCEVEAAICLSSRSDDGDDLLAEINIDINCSDPKCGAKLEAVEECNKKSLEIVGDKSPNESTCSKPQKEKKCCTFFVRNHKGEKCGSVRVEQAPKCKESVKDASSAKTSKARESNLSINSRKVSEIAEQSRKNSRKSSKKDVETPEKKSSVHSRKSSNFQELISTDGTLSCNSQKGSDIQWRKSSIRNKQDDTSRCDEEDIRGTLLNLQDKLNEISRMICSQESASVAADRLIKEINYMKFQLRELAQAVKSQTIRKSSCMRPSVCTKDSKTDLDKNIEEIKDQLQRLSRTLSATQPSSEYKKESESKHSCPGNDYQSGSINQFVLDKVEGLKMSVTDAIATEKACHDKANDTNNVYRKFEILQELQMIISGDRFTPNQERALELLEELQDLLNREFDRRSTVSALTEELIRPSSNPVHPSTHGSDSCPCQSSLYHKGSALSLQGSQNSDSLNERIQKILDELYTELQALNNGIKMRVPSILGEIISILDSLKKQETARQSFDEDQSNEIYTITPTPNLCCMVNQMGSVIRSVKPNAELPNCDFGSDFGSLLETMMMVLQSENIDADSLANTGRILTNMEKELQEQGAASTPQAECIRELIEMITFGGTMLHPEEDSSLESEPNSCTLTRNSEVSEGRIMEILNSIHSCVNDDSRLTLSQRWGSMSQPRSRKSVSNQYCEKSQSIENEDAALACADAVNSKAAIILAELRGIVQTLELEGSSLRDSTVEKIFSIFHHIECILESNRSNVCLLNEIKEILSKIEEKKTRSNPEILSSECSSTKSCSSQRQATNDARDSNNWPRVENLKVCINSLKRAL